MLHLEVGFAALFGLLFGSFLNVCIVRLPRGESIALPASHCRCCGKPLRARDNVPVLSWMALRGRSRCCQQPIGITYPLVESGTALLFVAVTLKFGVNAVGAGMILFCWLLFGLMWMDARDYLLPDAFTLSGILLGLLYQAILPASGVSSFHSALIGAASAIAVGGFLLLTALLYKLVRQRDGMGLGDVKLGAMLGAWLGWRLGGVALFVAIASGAVVGSGVLVGRLFRKSDAGAEPARLPFGTFLAGAAILTIFAGKPLLAWYMSFFS